MPASEQDQRFEPFERIYADRHGYARSWKERTGGKVVGYSCTYVPEEVLHAAGVLAVRMVVPHGAVSEEVPGSDDVHCPACRDWLAAGLRGDYDYVDGLMIAQSCLHVRQAYTTWRRRRELEFAHYLNMPHRVRTDHARTFLAGELGALRDALARWLGQPVDDAALRDGIRVVNRSRRLLRRLYDLRKLDPPPLTGTEATLAVLGMQLGDARDHGDLLEAALDGLEARTPPPEARGVRLLLIGSEGDDLEAVRAVERAGGTVVMDEHCTGSRTFWNVADEAGEPLAALANRYCDRPPCPTKDWEERERVGLVLRFAEEWGCRGAVILRQYLCGPHEVDIPTLRAALEEAGTPVLTLDSDGTVSSTELERQTADFLGGL